MKVSDLPITSWAKAEENTLTADDLDFSVYVSAETTVSALAPGVLNTGERQKRRERAQMHLSGTAQGSSSRQWALTDYTR